MFLGGGQADGASLAIVTDHLDDLDLDDDCVLDITACGFGGSDICILGGFHGDGYCSTCDHIGGTAPRQVRAAIERARERLGPDSADTGD